MSDKNKSNSVEKTKLHIRNKNRERYDLKALISAVPHLSNFVKLNKYNDESIDFSNPDAVKILNKALLHYYYGIEHWDIPEHNLCPPVPGRADYLHYMADILCQYNYGRIPLGEKIKAFDIGVGANCIYPIIGSVEYGWQFIGSDIDAASLESAQKIVDSNLQLKGNVEFRLQENPKDIFYGVIKKDELIDISICNPPFHASVKEANEGTARKVKNLTGKIDFEPVLNFAGKQNELWCDGGEHKFVQNMIKESTKFATNCFLFSTLVSKQSNLKGIYKALEGYNATITETIQMNTGNKSTRIVVWSFLTKEEQKEWKETRWKDKKPKD